MSDQILKWVVWVGVNAEDFEGQRDFYTNKLGLKELSADAAAVHYDLGAPHTLEIDLVTPDSTPPRKDVQLAFQVDDIEAAYEQLRARGVNFVTGIQGTKSRWAYFTDAEGNYFVIKQLPAPAPAEPSGD